RRAWRQAARNLREGARVKQRRTVMFLPDAGPRVGFGHVGRCLALAEAFASRRWRCLFVIADRAAAQEVSRRGYEVRRKPIPANIAVVDSYRRPRSLVRVAKRLAQRVAAIDDLHVLSPTDAHLVLRPSAGERSRRGVLSGAMHGRQRSLGRRIGAGGMALTDAGQTMYECLAMGTPTIALLRAPNQLRQYRAVIRNEAALGGGSLESAAWRRSLRSAFSKL